LPSVDVYLKDGDLLGPELLVDVICDTSFLIQIANKRIKNIDFINIEIGQISFLVPEVVLNELNNLLKDPKKEMEISKTLNYIKNFKIMPMKGVNADLVLLEHIKKNGGFIATLDFKLKNKIKEFGGSVITLSKNKIILES